MRFTPTPLDGSCLIDLEPIADARGFFARAWCAQEMHHHGLNGRIAQINTSRSVQAGTLRGLHFQLAPHAECTLVRCTKGAVFDVIVDLRPSSPTFLRWYGAELSEENHRALYSPEGFAQGFVTLAPDSEITYSTTHAYVPGYDWGVRWNDPQFGIELPVPVRVISERDANWPDFRPEYLDHRTVPTEVHA